MQQNSWQTQYDRYNTSIHFVQQQHPFSGPFSGTTQVSQYQKGKTNLGFIKQEIVSGSGISWNILKSAPHPKQITMPAPHHLVFFTGRMPLMPPNQQHQSTEGTTIHCVISNNITGFHAVLQTSHILWSQWKYLGCKWTLATDEHIMMEIAEDTCGMSKGPCRLR